MRRAIRYFTWFAVAIVVLAIAAALVLPILLDTPAVRAEIQRKLSEAVQGEVAWEDLSVRILPRPRGVLRKARVEIPRRLEVSADELAVRLAFWPLLRGRAEVVSVTLSRPAISLDVPAAQDAHDAGKDDSPPPALAETYRSTVGALADIVQRFAPETVLSIEDARLEFSAPGILPIALHDVAVRARTGHTGMDVDASMAGTHWSRVKIAARLQFADLSGDADIEVTGLKPQPWLDQYLAKSPVRIAIPAGDVRVQARTDGRTTLESEFEARAESVDVQRAGERLRIPEVGVKGKVSASAQEIVIGLSNARLGPSRLADGSLRYSLKDGSLAGGVGYDLDVAQGMDYTRRLVPAASTVLSQLHPATGRAQGRAKVALGRPDWNVMVEIEKSDAAIQVRDLPGPVRLTHGVVGIDRHSVKVSHVAASIPAGTVLLSTLRHSFKDGSTAGGASFDLDVARWLEIARRTMPGEERDAIQTAAGRARGNVKFAFGREDWKLGVDVPKSNISLEIRDLPGPVRIASWSMEAGPKSVTINRAAVSLLDASAVVSMTFDEFETGPRVRGAIAEGAIGAKYLAWVWQTAKLPARYEPTTPIRIAVPRMAWRPGGAWDIQASAQFDAGPGVAVDLGWASGALDIRRATIKDGRSDAALTLRAKGGVLEGRYAGALYGTSIAAVLKRANLPSGTVTGDFRFTIDRENPRRSSAAGHLKGEALNVASLTGWPLTIERIDLAADDNALRVRETTVDWAGQRVTIRGEIKRGTDGPVIDAQLDSPGVDLDALLKATESSREPSAGKRERSSMWPLPVTGQFAVRSNFVQRGRYRVAPVAATLALQPERARLEFQQAQLCGISLPMTIEATPAGMRASVRIAAQKQQLQQTAHCLSGENVFITGEFDLNADIVSQGKPGGFARNLQGSVVADMRDGDVMKFALLGNILSMQNVSALMKEGGPKLEAKGFPYRNLKIAGRFDKGRFVLDEGAFHSDAVGLAANGWISTTDYSSRLTVLVAPFSRLDELVRKVPVFGYVIGGVFTSVPVGVSGDIRDPLVVPLSPGAVGSEVLGIFERTLKLPVKLVTPAEK